MCIMCMNVRWALSLFFGQWLDNDFEIERIQCFNGLPSPENRFNNNKGDMVEVQEMTLSMQWRASVRLIERHGLCPNSGSACFQAKVLVRWLGCLEAPTWGEPASGNQMGHYTLRKDFTHNSVCVEKCVTHIWTDKMVRFTSYISYIKNDGQMRTSIFSQNSV